MKTPTKGPGLALRTKPSHETNDNYEGKNKLTVAITIFGTTKFDTQRKTNLSPANKIGKRNHRGRVSPTKPPTEELTKTKV